MLAGAPHQSKQTTAPVSANQADDIAKKCSKEEIVEEGDVVDDGHRVMPTGSNESRT